MAAQVTIGTIVLANGQRRHAEIHVGQITGKEVMQYRTPAGNWRNPLPTEAATFQPKITV